MPEDTRGEWHEQLHRVSHVTGRGEEGGHRRAADRGRGSIFRLEWQSNRVGWSARVQRERHAVAVRGHGVTLCIINT